MTFVSDHKMQVLLKGTKIIQRRPLEQGVTATDSPTGTMAAAELPALPSAEFVPPEPVTGFNANSSIR